MRTTKYERVRNLSRVAHDNPPLFYRLSGEMQSLADRLTIAQIAAIIDGPMRRAHEIGVGDEQRIQAQKSPW